MACECLTIWTIYDNPSDFPGWVVLRGHEVGPGVTSPRSDAFVVRQVEQAREVCRRMGLTCIGREAADEPQIVENWI